MNMSNTRATPDNTRQVDHEFGEDLEALVATHDADYLGSIKRNGELCDYYQLTKNGSISFIYVPRGKQN